MRGNLTCSFPGCERHPSKGDTILRISAKPGPFVGRCSEHFGPDGEHLAERDEAAVAALIETDKSARVPVESEGEG